MARPPRLLGLLPALAALRLFMFLYIVALFTYASSRDSSSSSSSGSNTTTSVPPHLRAADAWGPICTLVPPQAIALFNEAVRSYVGLRGQVLEPLNKALELTSTTTTSSSLPSSSSYLMAHIYRGSILLLSTGVLKDHPLVQKSYHAAKAYFLPFAHQQEQQQQEQQQQQSYQRPSPTARERLYFLAFHALYYPPSPDFVLSAAYWEEVLVINPRDILAVRSAHDAYIILGESEKMKRSLARVLSRWDLDKEEEEEEGREEEVEDEENTEQKKEKKGEEEVERDHRMVRSLWAFALEETGDLHRASLVARQVLKEDSTDVTALHALVHTYEMTGRKREGEGVYKEFRGKWEDLPSLFTNHLAWHRAVLALGTEDEDEEGREDEGGYGEVVWEVLDGVLLKEEGGREGGTVAPATPLAMADAASLLWRMMLVAEEGGREGGRVRRKWEELRKWYKEGGYETMHSTSFNDIHMMMCLSVVDLPAAKASLASMKKHAAHSLHQQQQQLKQQQRQLSQQQIQQVLQQWPRTREAGCRIGSQVARGLNLLKFSHWIQRTFGKGEGGMEEWKQKLAPEFSSSSSSSLPLPQATNSYVLSKVGLDVSEAFIHYMQGNYTETVSLLSASSSSWHLIGGSHAQRDVLELTLINACLKKKTNLDLAGKLLAERAMGKDEGNEEGVWTLLRRVEERTWRRRRGEEKEKEEEEGYEEGWLETAEL